MFDEKKSTASVTIPSDLLEPIIQAKVLEAVTAALGDKSAILEQAINLALTFKVDEKGQRSTYSSSIPFIQWLISDAIQKAARLAVDEAVANQKEAIKKALVAQLRNHKSPMVRQLVESMVGAMTNADTLKYRLTVSVVQQ